MDLLVSSRRFDLAALVEDEAIMALPPAPRHDDCSAPAVADAPAAGEGADAGPGDAAPAPRNPFGALAALKGGAEGGNDDDDDGDDGDDAPRPPPPRARPPRG